MAKEVVSTEPVPEEMKKVPKEASQASHRYNPVKGKEEFLKSIMDSEKKGGSQSEILERIHKVPKMLREAKDFEKYYKPQVVSIGPYYYGDDNLEEVEKLKPIIVKKFLESNGIPPNQLEFFDEFEEQIKEKNVEKWYDEEVTKKIGEAGLTQMMFVDGCFVLYFICCWTNCRLKNLGMKKYIICSVQQDLFLLENQLPFPVLKALMSLSEHYDSDDVGFFIDIFTDSMIDLRPILEDETTLHLLDLIRKNVLCIHKRIPETPINLINLASMKESTTTFRGVKELTAAGIHLSPNKTGNIWDVKFTSHSIFGKLSLPRMTIDSSTKQMFLNLIAYEACRDKLHEFEFTSYICFLDLLIDNADDVKELRNAGILVNYLGSDEDVAKLFNDIAADLIPQVDIYTEVHSDIIKYLSRPRKAKVAKWLAEVYRDHFKSPWTVSAVVAAFIILAATIVQTYFTVFPRANNFN